MNEMLDRCARAVCTAMGWGWDVQIGPGKNTSDIARKVAQAVIEEMQAGAKIIESNPLTGAEIVDTNLQWRSAP